MGKKIISSTTSINISFPGCHFNTVKTAILFNQLSALDHIFRAEIFKTSEYDLLYILTTLL